MNRRNMIGSMAGVAAATAVGSAFSNLQANASLNQGKLKGNIHHSVSQWCYGDIPLENFAAACKEMGLESVELLNEKDWAVIGKYGLKC